MYKHPNPWLQMLQQSGVLPYERLVFFFFFLLLLYSGDIGTYKKMRLVSITIKVAHLRALLKPSEQHHCNMNESDKQTKLCL